MNAKLFIRALLGDTLAFHFALAATLLMATFTSSTAWAEDAKQGSSLIGFVDIPYLIDRAPQALEAEQRLETEFAPRQLELEEQRLELTEVRKMLADVTLELSEAQYAQMEREARSLERRIERSEQDFREDLNIQKNNEFKNVRIMVLEAIAKFGELQDYDLIVSDGVLYANSRIDVTERILESLMKLSLIHI